MVMCLITPCQKVQYCETWLYKIQWCSSTHVQKVYKYCKILSFCRHVLCSFDARVICLLYCCTTISYFNFNHFCVCALLCFYFVIWLCCECLRYWIDDRLLRIYTVFWDNMHGSICFVHARLRNSSCIRLKHLSSQSIWKRETPTLWTNKREPSMYTGDALTPSAGSDQAGSRQHPATLPPLFYSLRPSFTHTQWILDQGN